MQLSLILRLTTRIQTDLHGVICRVFENELTKLFALCAGQFMEFDEDNSGDIGMYACPEHEITVV